MTDEQNPSSEHPAEHPAQHPVDRPTYQSGRGASEQPAPAASEQPVDQQTRRLDPLPTTEETTAYPFGFHGRAADSGYDGPGHSRYPFGAPTPGAPGPTLTAPPATAPGRAGRTLGTGVLLGALLLGATAGVGGAAGYEALRGDPTTTASSTQTTRTPLNVNAGNSAGDSAPVKGSPEQVAAEVLPSVVKINVSGSQGQGSGSGIILSSDGEILTNNHVVAVISGGGKMTVDFNDGSSAPATVVGADPVTDLAVIKAQGVSGLAPARLGDSDKLDVGEGVVAIGSPFGLEATVTSGIVSSLNRPVSVSGETSGTDTTYPAIQTDAAINPGNSGGPLVNMAGQVIGINSSIRTATSGVGSEAGSIGLGFAIPISKVLPVVEQLRNGETPTHARLGVSVSNTASADGLITGARIQKVESGSAGEQAGIKPGDIVTKVDDQPITSSESLVATIRGYRPGDQVTITVRRGGSTEVLKATLGSDLETQQS